MEGQRREVERKEANTRRKGEKKKKGLIAESFGGEKKRAKGRRGTWSKKTL